VLVVLRRVGRAEIVELALQPRPLGALAVAARRQPSWSQGARRASGEDVRLFRAASRRPWAGEHGCPRTLGRYWKASLTVGV
jgi:hypothetical protein